MRSPAEHLRGARPPCAVPPLHAGRAGRFTWNAYRRRRLRHVGLGSSDGGSCSAPHERREPPRGPASVIGPACARTVDALPGFMASNGPMRPTWTVITGRVSPTLAPEPRLITCDEAPGSRSELPSGGCAVVPATATGGSTWNTCHAAADTAPLLFRAPRPLKPRTPGVPEPYPLTRAARCERTDRALPMNLVQRGRRIEAEPVHAAGVSRMRAAMGMDGPPLPANRA